LKLFFTGFSHPNLSFKACFCINPTMIVFKDGEMIETLVGLMQKQALKDKLAGY
jgi:hypothetical protein